ncbi:MAG: sulfite exporter TauE/SafE family protein, partial [SAR324 cluster bacterium]|nr:sulfite exporter TauE/SafE family protein [SAR324 cluster bacterium]
IFGSQVGGWLLNRVAQRWVILSFSGIALFSSAHLIAGALGVVPSLSTAEPFLWVYPLIGVFSGFFSGFLGVGGGGLAILALSIGFDVEVLQGLPLALAVNVTNSLGGVLAQRGTSNIRWREVFQIFPAALVGIGAGTALALTLPPDALRIVFGLFFIYMGTMLFRKGLQENVRKGDVESGFWRCATIKHAARAVTFFRPYLLAAIFPRGSFWDFCAKKLLPPQEKKHQNKL